MDLSAHSLTAESDVNRIRSFFVVGRSLAPLVQRVLYPGSFSMSFNAIPKYISRKTSYIQV